MNTLGSIWAAVTAHLAASLAWQSFAALVVLFGVVLAVEAMKGRKPSRYLERSFYTDIVYTALIVGGAYAWLQQPAVT